jgi:hypothetical protein
MSPPSRLHPRLDEMDLSGISRPRPLQRNVAKADDVLDHFVKVRRFLPGDLSFDACRVNFFWFFVVWRFRNSLKNSNVIPAKLAVAG